ncbi:MAG: hypothetical protein AAFY03_05925, partial [Pseudomonadota bacterium]
MPLSWEDEPLINPFAEPDVGPHEALEPISVWLFHTSSEFLKPKDSRRNAKLLTMAVDGDGYD